MSAGEFSIDPGEMVMCDGQLWVIRRQVDFVRVLAQRVDDKREDFLEIANLSRVDKPAAAYPRTLRQLPRKELRKEKEEEKIVHATARFDDLMTPQRATRSERAELMQQYAAKYKCSLATAYRHHKAMEATGAVASVMRSQRKDKGAARLCKRTEEIIQAHLDEHRLIETPRSIPYIKELVNAALKAEGLPRIHLQTIYRRLKRITHREQLLAQGRREIVRELYSAKAWVLPDNHYPLCIVGVDHTPAPVCLVDDNRQPIGTAHLSLAIDCYSRMVLGFYLSLESPSTLTTGMALAHAFLPKEQYLEDLGVKGTWPCWGLPDVVVVDNAVELNGHMMHAARQRYRFNLRDRPKGKPNFGGHVESAFKTFMLEFKGMPGTTFSNWRERGEYDSEGQAILTLRELEIYFTEFLVNDYHLKPHSGDGMQRRAPLTRWITGTFDGDVFPPTGLPARILNPEMLRISLLPKATRALTRGTVRINNQKYHSVALHRISDRMDAKAALTDRLVEIRYDPRNLACVWVYDDDAGEYIEVPNTDDKIGNTTKWDMTAIKREERNRPDIYEDERAESKYLRQEMLQGAQTRTKKARRQVQIEKNRAAGALVQPVAPAPPQRSTPAAPAAPMDEAKRAALRARIRTSAGEKK